MSDKKWPPRLYGTEIIADERGGEWAGASDLDPKLFETEWLSRQEHDHLIAQARAEAFEETLKAWRSIESAHDFQCWLEAQAAKAREGK